jgi:hypothetical protein
MNEAQTERRRASQRRGKFVGCNGGNVSDKTDVIFWCTVKVCEHCGVLACNTEKLFKTAFLKEI